MLFSSSIHGYERFIYRAIGIAEKHCSFSHPLIILLLLDFFFVSQPQDDWHTSEK